MALCLATSLIERGGFDAADQMQRYMRWWQRGLPVLHGKLLRHWHHRSCRTFPVRAGRRPVRRLHRSEFSRQRFADAACAGADVLRVGRRRGYPHGRRQLQDDSWGEGGGRRLRYFAGLLVGALEGVDKETLLSPGYCPVEGPWEREALAEEIARIADGSFKDRNPPEIRGTGYVVQSLEAALWAFHHSNGFREGALLAANLGADADTTAAIYGQIAGAYYGVDGIPAEWRDQLTMAAEITSLADSLHDHAQEHMPPEPDVGHVRPMASTTEQSGEMAGVHVRWVSVIVEGHTVSRCCSTSPRRRPCSAGPSTLN